MAHISAAGGKRLSGRLVAVIVLLAAAIFLNYIDRGNLAIAAPLVKAELHISAAQLGMLLSAFFWTYALMQNVSGWLVDRLNVNWVLAGGFFVWSAATAGTGWIHTLFALFAIRLLLGMGESVAFPACSKIIALNVPEQHRGLANSTMCAGLLAGPGFGMLLGGTLMARFGWRPFFVILGLASLLWLGPWIKFMPRRSAAEQIEDDTALPSLSEMLRLRCAWGTFLGLFCGNYVNYFLITWLPYFLVVGRGFSMTQMARIGGVAYVLSAGATILAGKLSDVWVRRGASPSLARKTFTAGGITLSGVSLGIAPLSSPRVCVIMVTLGVIGLGVCASNVYAIAQRLSGPRMAGRWTGFLGFIGNLAGVIAPAVTGFVLQRTGSFVLPFAILSAFAFASAAFWIFLVGPLEPVIWKSKAVAEPAAVAA